MLTTVGACVVGRNSSLPRPARAAPGEVKVPIFAGDDKAAAASVATETTDEGCSAADAIGMDGAVATDDRLRMMEDEDDEPAGTNDALPAAVNDATVTTCGALLLLALTVETLLILDERAARDAGATFTMPMVPAAAAA